MRLLLDTHALLWALGDESLLSAETREAVRERQNVVVVSPVSVWEIEIKRRAGKLAVDADYLGKIDEAGLSALPVSLAHGAAAGRLPLHHRDPFDRMLVAQAQLESLTIVTRDRDIARYDVPVMLA